MLLCSYKQPWDGRVIFLSHVVAKGARMETTASSVICVWGKCSAMQMIQNNCQADVKKSHIQIYKPLNNGTEFKLLHIISSFLCDGKSG